MFICICGDADGDACGIRIPGMFICICGDADGDACGMFIPGMFICICPGEGWGAGDCVGDDEGLAGIFIPGMLSISFLFAGLFFAGAFLLRGRTLRLCIPGIFMPGMFIPGMLLMSCFFVGCFFRVAFLGFRVVAFDLGFGFDLLVPGMLDISCCAKTGKSATNRKLAKTSEHTLILKRKLIALTFFIIPLKNSSAPKKSFN